MTVVPARAAWSATVRTGQFLTLTDLHGNQAVDFLVYDAHDTAVRYSAPDTLQAGSGSSSPPAACSCRTNTPR